MHTEQRDQIPWAALVERTRAGDTFACQELCMVLADAARVGLQWGVDGQGVDDDLQDVVVTLLESIRDGVIRDPERLMGFVRTVTRRRVSHHIRTNIERRRRLVEMGEMDFPAPQEQSPEAAITQRERAESLQRVLRLLSALDREILTRFYFEEQDQEQICREMGITFTQFRLYKSRALARCSRWVGRGKRPRAMTA